MTVLIKMPRASQILSTRHRIRRLLDERTRSDINWLDGLAPKRPAPGELHGRNTEYPNQESAGAGWRAPAEADCFSLEEFERSRRLAHRLLRDCGDLVSAIERLMPKGGRP
jgi:hypothetical protein